MTWPAIVIWLFLVVGLISRGPLILYVGAVASCFGTLQMLPGELVGGTNFLPGSVYSMLLVLKILSRQDPRAMLRVATDPSRLGLLFAFYIWCLFSAFVMPRLFAGQVDVIPIVAQVPWPVPLQPTAANLTQPAYLTISIFSALAAYFAARQPGFVKHMLQASAVGGLTLIGTGLIDMLVSGAGQSGLLEPFRNATYSLLTDVELAGSRRVVGMMPEASTYGGACAGTAAYLAFLRPCFAAFWRDRIVPFVILGSVAMALLSTSSTAYVGLSVFLFIYLFNWIRRWRSTSRLVHSGITTEAMAALAAILLLLIFVTIAPGIFDAFYGILDQVIFQKSQSESFEERNMWTRVGFIAFTKTFGLGVGFGAVRTSNWFVGELANTGIIGSLLLAVFLLKVLIQNVKEKDATIRELVTGLRLSSLPSFVGNAIAGTTPDVGGTFNDGLIVSFLEARLTNTTIYKSEATALERVGKRYAAK